MRTLGIVFLSLTPLFFGLDYGKTLKLRRDFFYNFKEFIIFVKEQIRFSCRERDEIFAIALNDSRFNSNIYSNIKKALKNGESITKIFKYDKDIRFNNQEISEIEAFFNGLGNNDAEGQISHCNYYLSVFEQITAKATETCSVKSRLSLGLCLSLASVMFIIMI